MFLITTSGIVATNPEELWLLELRELELLLMLELRLELLRVDAPDEVIESSFLIKSARLDN